MVSRADGPRTIVGTLPTPAGPLTVAVSEDGVVRASVLGDLATLRARVAQVTSRRDAGTSGAWADRDGSDLVDDPAVLPGEVASAVARYADGDHGALSRVPVAQPGGVFQQEVWRALRAVPAGRTVSYAALAAAAGRPSAVRAAAASCARNLVAPFVPCHRVVRTDGALGGYAFGLDVKRALLVHEGASV